MTHHEGMKTLEGDLLDLAEAGTFDVIVHGCNCFHTMRSGIAGQLSSRYPEVIEADRKTPYGARSKLGSISVAKVHRNGRDFAIANAYTQHRYGRQGVFAEVDAIASAFREVARQFPGQRIGYPRVGAGLAGGDWSEIAPVIVAALAEHDATLVEFVPTVRPTRPRP